ncbi:MAG: glycosyltransferase [Actinobacteria bacterium]|uniref:Unannotated protein n=1 Tax=freshwater metagenome TaxID=449393 RepID=A0A6J5ZGB1_9ZZZZ|nr:glycosyltransferase [Actinomycetota bacterium]
MIVYAVPSEGIFGGIKVAYQTVDALLSLGVSACIATPDGRASQWFRSSAPVLARAEALSRMSDDDLLMFSLPHDYVDLKASGRRLVFHCQGTNPLIDPVICDPDVELLACWRQAREYTVEIAGRESTDVGIQVTESFFYAGQTKLASRVSYMPRRGAETARRIALANPQLRLEPIDGLDEDGVAARLAVSSVFIASSEGEAFGLPALEAMASGCIVLSVPVVGGTEFLRDGDNCFYGDVDHLARSAKLLTDPASRERLSRMRNSAVATALRYRPAVSRGKLERWAACLSEAQRGPFGEVSGG